MKRDARGVPSHSWYSIDNGCFGGYSLADIHCEGLRYVAQARTLFNEWCQFGL